jgi:aryl-alcohol dehydrogenase-like predicted oxidoreductase
MDYQLFGRTGMRVSRFALGTMTFGTAWEFGADPDECARIFDAYLDAGGNFVDTADKYTDGEAEGILGALLGSRRDRIVLATKYGLCTDPNDPNSLGNSRRNLVLSVEGSLRRLKTDYIDLLWVHAWYFENPVADTVRALDDLVTAGKILYWGISDAPAWLCAEASSKAMAQGWAPLSALQMEYSLIERTPDRELLPFAAHNGLGVTGSIPLAGGILTGKHHEASQATVDSARAGRAAARRSERIDQIVECLNTTAGQLGVSATHLALAWLVETQPTIIPILGVRTLDQLEDNLAALRLDLDRKVIDSLNEASAVELGFPHEMLRGQRMQEVMYGPFGP